MSTRPETPLLDTVNTPEDLRKLDKSQLRQLSDELRAEVIDAVGQTGGHLGSGLGVVELTAAIHYVFDTPQDKLVWDVGHQCYPHKILTGRRDRIRTLRQGGGLSGFTSVPEASPFVPQALLDFRAFAMANKMQDRRARYAVIGDGAMSAGMAYGDDNPKAASLGCHPQRRHVHAAGGGFRHLARMVSSTNISASPWLKIAKGSAAAWGTRTREEYARGWPPAARCSKNSASITSARSMAPISSI